MDHDNNLDIKIISRRVVCENSKFFVYFDHVIDIYAGVQVPDYMIVAPKHSGNNLVTGVAILPIIKKQVGLIRIYRPTIHSYSWEIPQGFMDQGESAPISAVRELREETGIIAVPGDLTNLGLITPDTGVLAARVHLFLVTTDDDVQEIVPEIGLRELNLFSFHRIEEMIVSSEIQDASTLSAWCKYRLFEKSGFNRKNKQ